MLIANCFTQDLISITKYRMEGNFGEGETLANLANRPWFAKLKLTKLVLIINNLLTDLLIPQTLFCQMLEMSQLAKFPPAKLSLHTVFCLKVLLVYLHWLLC